MNSHLGYTMVAVVALLLAACERPAPSAQTASAPNSQSAAPVAPVSRCPLTTPVLTLDAAYQSVAREAFDGQFATQSEEEALAAIQARPRHYLYTGFLDKFPQTSHRTEVECRLRGFALFEATEPTVVARSELVTRFNFEGELTRLGRWNKGLVAVLPDGVRGSPMIGSLQFLEADTLGGIVASEQGLKLPKNARFIYATVPPPSASASAPASK